MRKDWTLKSVEFSTAVTESQIQLTIIPFKRNILSVRRIPNIIPEFTPISLYNYFYITMYMFTLKISYIYVNVAFTVCAAIAMREDNDNPGP